MKDEFDLDGTEKNHEGTVHFVVHGQPQGKARARITKIGNFARAYTPKQTVDYENRIKHAYNERYGACVYFKDQTAIEIHVTAIHEIPKSFTQIKRRHALGGVLCPLVKPDADNILKVVCDALNKVAYADDKQVIKMCIEKMYGIEPRLEIKIKELKHE